MTIKYIKNPQIQRTESTGEIIPNYSFISKQNIKHSHSRQYM